MKEDEFPELGLGAQAAASKGGGGKKVKKGKGRKMALDEFNSVGINHLDERSKILNALPKHATGAEVPDRFGRGGTLLPGLHASPSSFSICSFCVALRSPARWCPCCSLRIDGLVSYDTAVVFRTWFSGGLSIGTQINLLFVTVCVVAYLCTQAGLLEPQ